MKSDNKIYEDVWRRIFQVRKCLEFEIVDIKGETDSVAEKIILGVTELSKNVKWHWNSSVEDALNIHITAPDKITFLSEITNIINEENVTVVSRQGKK